MSELWRHRGFRLLLFGQTMSMFGDWTLLLVFGIWAKTLTGSDVIAGLMLFALAAPGLLGPLGGWVADRVRRRHFMIALNLASVPVLLMLWFVHDRGQLWLLVAVAVWVGASGVVFNATMSGFVQWLLPAELIGPANGSLATVRQALRIIAPFVGAGLFVAVGGAWVATLDAVTFVLAAAALVAVRCHETRPAHVATHFRADLTAGLSHLRATPELRRLTVVVILAGVAFGPLEAGVFALVDGLGRPPAFLGVLAGAQGIGSVLGGIAVTMLIRRTHEARLLVIGLGLTAVGTLACAIPTLATAVLGFTVFGVGLPLYDVAAMTWIQHRTPNAIMSRTSAAVEVAGSVPFTVFIAVGAALVASVPYEVLFLAVGVAIGVTTLFAMNGLTAGKAAAPGEVHAADLLSV